DKMMLYMFLFQEGVAYSKEGNCPQSNLAFAKAKKLINQLQDARHFLVIAKRCGADAVDLNNLQIN
ncbi:MAG: hypothetical protein O3C05_03230, partial [Proteobacteria bacterium]|nr:hypothetical protein [Pseudomonadota bacterium]